MDIVTHQLQLAIDGVVNANHILTDVGRLRDGRDVLTGAIVRFGEGSRVQFKHYVRIDQVGRNRIVWEGLTGRQPISLVECQFGWVLGSRDHRNCAVGGSGIGQ